MKNNLSFVFPELLQNSHHDHVTDTDRVVMRPFKPHYMYVHKKKTGLFAQCSLHKRSKSKIQLVFE